MPASAAKKKKLPPPAWNEKVQALQQEHPGIPELWAIRLLRGKATLEDWHQERAREEQAQALQKTNPQMPSAWAKRIVLGEVKLEDWHQRLAREEQAQTLRQAYPQMPSAWVKRVVSGRVTLESTLQEWQKTCERAQVFREATRLEFEWTRQHADDLALVTYEGVIRCSLRKIREFYYKLAQGSKLPKIDVVALLPGVHADTVTQWAAWVPTVRAQHLRVAANVAERHAFPVQAFQTALLGAQATEIVTLDGHRWAGRIAWDSLYAFLLETSSGVPVMVLKHAVFSVSTPKAR